MVFGAAVVAVVVLGGATLIAMRTAANFLSDRADTKLRDVARRGELVTEQALLERARQVELIGASPTVVDAARAGAARAAQMGLVGKPIDVIEKQMAATKNLAVSETATRFLQRQLAPLSIAEMFVTDANGFNSVTTEMTSDFVQSDEAWWQRAMRAGVWGPEADYDESTRQVVAAISLAIHEPGSTRALGAVKLSYGMAATDQLLAQASSGTGIVVDLIDARGDVVATSGSSARMETLAGFASLERAGDQPLDEVRGPGHGAAPRAKSIAASA